jgi:hypothetical protein
MDIALWVATITAAVSVAGWLVNHVLSARRDLRNEQRRAYLSYTERQLEDLYGPLSILIIEGRQSLRDLLASFGRNVVFPDSSPLPPEELQTWLFWTENNFLPRNEKIKSLLSGHAHLIEGQALPDSYIEFLDHCNSWAINHLRWQRDGTEYAWRSRINYPNHFTDEVIATTQRLKRRHADLVNVIGGAAD